MADSVTPMGEPPDVRRRAARAVTALLTVVTVGACASKIDTMASQRAVTVPPTTAAVAPTTTTAAATSTTLGAATTAPTTETPTTAATDPNHGFPPSWRPAPLQWSDCGSTECAKLNVPLDWSQPDGGNVTLELTRHVAKRDHKGSVLVNPGGPGGSGVDFVQSGILTSSPFDSLTENYDVVGWDPRGVGKSNAVTCGGDITGYLHLDSAPDTDAEWQQLDDAATSVSNDCGEADARLLPHISTDDSVRDMEAIRRALGDDKLTYYGFSYGTALGSQYADWFPDKVRAIVLDGVVDPTQDLEGFLAAQTAAFDRQLTAIFNNCGGLSSCPVANPAASYDDLAARLETTPLKSGDKVLGPAELAVAAVAVTYVDGSESDFVNAIDSALKGDPDPMLEVASYYYDSVDFAPYLAIECVDQPHPKGLAEWRAFSDRLEKISPRVGGSVANELIPCAQWPTPPVRKPYQPKAVGSPPILVLGNTGDAATPVEQAEKMAKGLQNGHLVISDGLGHTSYGNPCIDRISAAYLTSLTVPADGTRC